MSIFRAALLFELDLILHNVASQTQSKCSVHNPDLSLNEKCVNNHNLKKNLIRSNFKKNTFLQNVGFYLIFTDSMKTYFINMID